MASQPLLSLAHRPESLPKSYVRPETHRPRLGDVESSGSIPVIDLAAGNETQIIAEVDDACLSYGFFQVVNHGIPVELMLKMLKISEEFFKLPAEEKMMLYSNDPEKKVRLSASFNSEKEEVYNWRDYLRLHCHPLEEYVPSWPSKPDAFRDVVSEYCLEVRRLGSRLLRFISLGLGLEEDYILRALGEQEQHMAINYYPPCPQPELTYGLPAHTDPNALTILLQDFHVAGLQILRPTGKWVAVDPRPEALIINIGDQLQALSNGKYKSIWHRAVVNSSEERLSVASFLAPNNNAVISPAEQLVGEKPPVYRSFTYDEYYKKFWTRSLDQGHCLELFESQ